MSDIQRALRDFLAQLKQEHGDEILKFLYNLNSEDFVPGEHAIYYSGPYWDDEEIIRILENLFLGRWLVSGEDVQRFEIAFSRQFNLEASVMVNSGSSANLVMVNALKKHFDWGDGDEVILSVVGFPTTVSPLMQAGLKPVFADISMADLNFDLDQVEAKITSRTRAILISPVLGNPPDMARLADIGAKHGVHLVLDNCDSLGSRWDGNLLSDYCVASSCSFYPAHHLCTGEGGMVSARDRELIRTARSLAWWGRDCDCVGSANLFKDGSCTKRFAAWLPGYDGLIDHKYVFTNVGFNLKPLDLQGAIGLAQLTKFDEIHRRRRENKARVAQFVRGVEGVRVVDEHERAETSWFGVPIVCDAGDLKQRLVAHLEGHHVQTRNYFGGNILLHPAYAHLDNALDHPEACQVLDKVFFLGCTPTYSEGMLQYMGEVLQQFDPAQG